MLLIQICGLIYISLVPICIHNCEYISEKERLSILFYNTIYHITFLNIL